VATSVSGDVERSLHRTWESARRLSSSTRYGGADPWSHLNTRTENLFNCVNSGFQSITGVDIHLVSCTCIPEAVCEVGLLNAGSLSLY